MVSLAWFELHEACQMEQQHIYMIQGIATNQMNPKVQEGRRP